MTSSSSCNMPGLVVALDINGTIIDGDSLAYEDHSASTALTEPARQLITDITKRIAVDKQNIQVVIFTLGMDWPVVVEQIESLSSGVITFDRTTSAFYMGRAAGADPPAVFVRKLTEDRLDHDGKFYKFEYDGILYDGPNPEWKDPGPQLSYDEYRKRTEGRHLVMRAVYNSRNPAVMGREDNKLPAKLIVSQLPVIVFDDHPKDWEVVAKHQKVVTAVSPAYADEKHPETDFCKELKLFEQML